MKEDTEQILQVDQQSSAQFSSAEENASVDEGFDQRPDKVQWLAYKPGYFKNLLKKLNDASNAITTFNSDMKKENLILMNNQAKTQSKQDSESCGEQSTGPTSIS